MDDLTTRARIRDAAVTRFAADGFTASVRTIAADAGVSPGLVLHHFGSKDGLREACDAVVLAELTAARADVLDQHDARPFLESIASSDRFAGLAAYVLRSLQAGGDLARHVYEQLVADSAANLAAGVAAGTVRPSRDPDALARYLTATSLGLMLLDHALRPPGEPWDVGAWVRELVARTTLPALELMTDGLLTDSTLLDAYLATMPSSPAEQGVTHQNPPETVDKPMFGEGGAA